MSKAEEQVQAPIAPDTVLVWPEGMMPGRGAREPEGERPAKGDGFHRVTNISRPALTLFRLPKQSQPAPAMIVCPGGGYGYVVVDKEGSEIAAWLNSNGVSAVVLKYRTPNNRDGALQDIQRALSLVRSHAAEWNIDPKRLGVIGFSAGGHLAARASVMFEQRTYPPLDEVDKQSCRPDYAVLVYPAYLDRGGLSPLAATPPTLIIHSEDDSKFIKGSKIHHEALEAAKVPNEFILYATGGHGYGLRCEREARAWPQAALAWLQKMGIKKENKQ